MGALLNFLFLIFLAGIFFVGMLVYRIYRSIHEVRRQFRNFGQGGGNGTDGRYSGHRQDNDEVIIDHRDEDKANRRIFSDNEGEYVDFEEEK